VVAIGQSSRYPRGSPAGSGGGPVAKSATRAWVVRSCASLRHGSCVGDTLDHDPRGCAAAGVGSFIPKHTSLLTCDIAGIALRAICRCVTRYALRKRAHCAKPEIHNTQYAMHTSPQSDRCIGATCSTHKMHTNTRSDFAQCKLYITRVSDAHSRLRRCDASSPVLGLLAPREDK
jgi:hypothetical protein